MGSNPFAPKKRYSPRPLADWEKKEKVQFYWDGESTSKWVWWQCPHMTRFERLNSAQWTILTTEPLTVKESIQNNKCGCHGHIVNDTWVPAGSNDGISQTRH